MRDLFLLDANVTFLNHGSFGACPKPVFETYQRWQRELERQPVEFLGRRFAGLMEEARTSLATYIGGQVDNLVFMPNATAAVNVISRSLDLQPGDEILISNHEYGACELAWRYVCDKSGAKVVEQPVPLPITSHADTVAALMAGVTDRTRLILISHITSPTGLIFPVADIVRQARERGILTLVDGAHVPGQLDLNVDEINADFYVGNCHKWLCAPKGAGFLYARPEHHAWLYPLVVGWGMMAEEQSLVNRHQWQGTRDIAAYLTVKHAIQFQAENDWPAVRQRCHELAREMRQRLADLTGLPSIMPDSPEYYMQMVAAPLPEMDMAAAQTLKDRLYDEFQIEVPITLWDGKFFIRVAYQGYNTLDDSDALINSLRKLLVD